MNRSESWTGLSILAGSGTLEPLPDDARAALERVEIDAALGERGTFRLGFRLGPGSDLPARFFTGSGDLVRVIVSTAEGTASRVAMDGLLVTHSISSGAGGLRMDLAGEDLTLLMDLIDQSGRPFPGAPVAARVATILAAYSVRGVFPSIVPPPLQEIPNPAERTFHQRGTDYAYLRSLARQAGYRFTLDPGPEPGAALAYWGPEPRADRAFASLAVSFEHPDVVEGLELRFDAMRRVTPQGAILHPASKVAIPIPVPAINALREPLGAVVPPAHRHRRQPGMAKLGAMQAAGELLAAAARSAEAMTGRGTLSVGPARRRLRPGDLVEVLGAAPPYRGLYCVRRVHDFLTAESHRQEFELVRAGLGAAGGDPP